jgi:HK97 family phage portal protein
MIRELVAGALGFKAAEIRFQTEWLRAPIMDLSFGNIVREGYRKNSAVYSCIRVHATAFPEPPLVVKRMTERGQDPVDNHPLTKLMERPNPFMGQAEFWSMTATWMAVGGNAYIWKRRNVAGRAMELWPLHDGLIRPVLHPSQWISGYLADAGDGRKVPVPTEDIIHLRWAPDPLQPQVGITPIIAVAREVDTDNEAARYIHALLKNDAVPRTLVTVKNGLTDGAFKRLKSQFREQYGGAKRGDVMILEGQEMSIDRLGLNLNELADAALRRVPETRISGAFEVPAILAGLGSGLDSATYSNAKELREFFTETTLIPRWRAVASQFQVQLLPEFGAADDLVVEFELSRVRALADDEDAKWTRWRGAWVDGIATLNETRVALGLDPTKFGDIFLRAGKAVSVDHDPTEAPDPPPTDPNGHPGPPAVTAEGRDRRAPADGDDPRALPAAGRPPAPSRNALESSEHKADDDPGERLAQLRDQALEKIASALEQAVGESFVNLAAVVAGRIADGEDEPLEVGDHDELIGVLGDGHAAAYNQAVLDVRGVLGGGANPPEFGDVDLSDSLKELETTSAADVAVALATARADPGEKDTGWATIAERVLARLTHLWVARAKIIAVTEAVQTYNRGFLDAYEQAAHGTLVQVSDGDSDKPCRDADGKLWTIEYARAHPSEHPNCRRRFGPPKREKAEAVDIGRSVAWDWAATNARPHSWRRPAGRGPAWVSAAMAARKETERSADDVRRISHHPRTR